MNWSQEIVKLVLVKEAIAEVDRSGLWTHHLPSVAATQSQLLELNTYLGYTLDVLYADFLYFADGWQGFYQSVDLFGSTELIGGEKMQLALDSLMAIEDAALKRLSVSRADLLPIAATAADLDIFFLVKPNSSMSGAVLWFAGQEIDTFKNFNEFFLAMADYNREELSYFKVNR